MAQKPRTNWLFIAVIALLVVAAVVLASRHQQAPPPHQPKPSASATVQAPGQSALQTCGPVDLDDITLVYRDKRMRPKPIKAATFYPNGCPTKTDQCVYFGTTQSNPDPKCSPGAIYDLTPNTNTAKYDELANQKVICATYANAPSGKDRRDTPSSVGPKDRRNVPSSVDRAVWQHYGKRKVGEYETDHIIPLSLGGSNNIANLYPQLKTSAVDMDEKDRLEGYLARAICDPAEGSYPYKLHLSDIQRRMATDWYSLYQEFTAAGRLKASA